MPVPSWTPQELKSPVSLQVRLVTHSNLCLFPQTYNCLPPELTPIIQASFQVSPKTHVPNLMSLYSSSYIHRPKTCLKHHHAASVEPAPPPPPIRDGKASLSQDSDIMVPVILIMIYIQRQIVRLQDQSV